MEIPFLGEVVSFVARNFNKPNPKKYMEDNLPKINLNENEELKRFANGLIDIHHIEFSGSSGHWFMFQQYALAFMEDAEHDDWQTAFSEKYMNDAEFLVYGIDFIEGKINVEKEKKAVELLNTLSKDDKDILRWYFTKRDY